MRITSLAGLIFLLSVYAPAQKKHYNSLYEALYAGTILRGDPGPSDVRWIENGTRFSYTKNSQTGQQIWVYTPEDQTEEMVFSENGYTFPASDRPFRYSSFQWTRDFENLLFQTNFKRIWRNSGNADYYLYSLEDKSLKLIVNDAFTAEVSPDGMKVGYGKNGNLYIVDLTTGQHTPLTDDGKDKFYNGRFGWANEEEFGLVRPGNGLATAGS